MLPAIGIFLLALFGVEDAVVREEQVPLLQRADASSPVVRTLVRGNRVKVLYAVANDGGDWCEVEAGAQSGYVRCNQLDWPGGKNRGEVVPPVSAVPRLEVPPSPRAPAAGELQNLLLLHNYNPGFWAQRLKFDVDQRGRVGQLMRSSGLSGCAVEFRAMLRQQGIHDFPSFALAGDRLDRTAEGRAIRVQMERCGNRLLTFWGSFPGLLTQAQKAQWEKERRLVPPSAGYVESLMRILFAGK